MATQQPKRRDVVRGLPLAYSAAIEQRYRDGLEKMVKQMTAQTEAALTELLASDPALSHFGQDASISAQARILFSALSKQFSALFNKQGRFLAKSMLQQSSDASQANLTRSLQNISQDITLTKPMTPTVQDVAKASIAENVSLIKTIPQQYFAQIEQQVMRSITTGQGLKDLVPFIQGRGQVTQSRARLIANDQTKKVYTNINKARMADAGITKFEWLHSAGGREPRPYHQKKWPNGLNGGIFSINDPPVIDDKTGERGLPSQLVNCRCQMIPVIDFGDNNADSVGQQPNDDTE